MKSNILVAGGCGFVGSNIAEKIKKKHNVSVVDNLLTGKRENIAGFEDEVDLIVGDLKNYKTCMDVTEGVDVVLHLAALPSVPRSLANPRATNENNVSATVNLLKACVDNNVKRVVFSSSSSVYGNTKTLPKKETMMPRPVSPYAASKLAGEYYMKVFSDCFDIDTVSLRFFNIFGPRQDRNSQYSAVIPKFIDAFLGRGVAEIYGDNRISRDFTFVDNVIKANMLAALSKKDLNGEVFNIACGERVTLLDLVDVIERVGGGNLMYEQTDARVGDVRHSLADISKAGDVLGYKPTVGFEDGIRKTLKYYSGMC